MVHLGRELLGEARYFHSVSMFVDVITATGCTVGHRTLRVEDYGKVAAAFVDTTTGHPIRVAPGLDIRELACSYVQDESRHYLAQMEAYQIMPDEEMLMIQEVVLNTPIEKIVSKPGVCVNCNMCGEEIMNEREVRQNEFILCPPFAYGRYYQIVSGNRTEKLPDTIQKQTQMIC